MADDKDELADALAAMSESAHVEEPLFDLDVLADVPMSEGDIGSVPVPLQRPAVPGVPVARTTTPVPSPAPAPKLRPPPVAPGAAATPLPTPPRPVSPAPVRPASPSSRPAQPAPPSARPASPVQNSPRPADPKPADGRPVRPLAPSLAAPPPPSGAPNVPFLPGIAAPVTPDDAFVTDEEDDFVMPAPSPDILQPRKAPLPKPTWQPSLTFRRTVIPICLTFGLIATGLGIAWFRIDPSSIFRRTGIVMPITLLVMGPISLTLAALNMMAVKAEMKRVGIR